MTDEVSQRERAINLCQELAIEENEQVLKVIIYALNKWTNSPQSALLREVPVRFAHNGFEDNVDRMAQAVIDDHPGSTLSAAYRAIAVELFNSRAELRESEAPPLTVEEVAATAYQILGVMDAPVRVLDYFSAIGNGERPENILPFSPDELRDASPRTQESPTAQRFWLDWQRKNSKKIDSQTAWRTCIDFATDYAAELRESEASHQPSQERLCGHKLLPEWCRECSGLALWEKLEMEVFDGKIGWKNAVLTAFTEGRKGAASHWKFVTEHDGLLPEPGFGGCSCGDCELVRKYLADNPEKLRRLLKGGQPEPAKGPK